MNFAESIHTGVEMGLALLVVLLAMMLVRSRRLETKTVDRLSEAIPMGAQGQTIGFPELKEWVKESESICETLSKNLQEKRKIAKRLIAQLDSKIDQMNQVAERISPAEEVRTKDLYAVITEMSDSGCLASQIARWLKVSEGEVQLVLDLKKFGHREDPEAQMAAPRV